ncbi:hypothetical protein [Kribbella sp. NPDC004536]|uniref:hypothetical protein n=1 Tax=Kribbella sp. NPDC004536 TaxID=3364106 RepID=UPI0036AE6163
MDQPTSSSNENSGTTRYSTVWRCTCYGVGIIGVVLAGLLLSGMVLAVVGVAVLVVGATAATAYGVDDDPPPSGSRTRAVCNAMVGAAVVGVAFGLSTILGPGVVLLCVALALTSPPAVRWYRAKSGASHHPEQATRPTLELCREWHDSFEALAHATTTNARLRIVIARERCLDELERRDPEGLHAWLESSASAAGDPRSFLTDPTTGDQ